MDDKTINALAGGEPDPHDSEALCLHCGYDKSLRNPSGTCDHLYWPDLLTDEAKRANGYVKMTREVEVWIKAN